LCLKRSEEKESGLSLDLGVEELIGTARRECENLVAVKDIFFLLQPNKKNQRCFFYERKMEHKMRLFIYKNEKLMLGIGAENTRE